MRCADCGQKTAKASQYCVLCGAPVGQQRSKAAEPSAGASGGAIAAGGATPPASWEALPEVGDGTFAEWAEWARTQRFSATRLRPGYHPEEVDAFVGAICDTFLGVRDADAQRSAREVDAQAYSVGNDVIFGAGRFAPDTAAGRHLLAHELAHVVQHRGDGTVHRYRKKSCFAFGERDTPVLVEQSFNARTDKETKPWIELVTVEFSERNIDTDDGTEFWTGTAYVHYHDNPVKLRDFSFTVAGGPEELKTTIGRWTVERIEGTGYNSSTHSGPVPPGTREDPPHDLYSKDRVPATGKRNANMSYAVFFHDGEALHEGPLQHGSHGCEHVDWDLEDLMKQVNYHSVIGLTQAAPTAQVNLLRSAVSSIAAATVG